MPYHVSHPILVVPYDPRWPALFEEERVRLLAALVPSIMEIEHFGSTSVPGMAAKPILDMLAAVRSLEDVDPLTDALAALGYQDASVWLGGWAVPDRRLFCLGPYNEGTHHLHFVVLGSEPWTGNLRFRDRLRSDPDLAAAYARLKRELAETHGADVDGYTEGKAAFVLSVVKDDSTATDIEITECALEQKSILGQLLELYLYDFSEFEGTDVGPHGVYGYRYLDHYWTEEGRHPYLIRVGGLLAGFVLVNRHGASGDDRWSVAEFFVMRKYRGKGVGGFAANAVFDRHPGPWEVAQVASHPGSTAFWRKVIGRYTGGRYEERQAQWRGHDGPVQLFEAPQRSAEAHADV